MQTTRRQLLGALAATGIGSLVFQRALAAQAAASGVTSEMIKQAEWIAGIKLDDDQRDAITKTLDRTLLGIEQLRAIPLTNDVPPAISFRTLAHDGPATPPNRQVALPASAGELKKPDSNDDLAYLPVSKLAPLLRDRKVTSVELTKLYLQRLKDRDPQLMCVVNFTEELALKQAEQADKEIGDGKWRGPLHGVPWGAKDLIAVPGYPTTWGAPQYREQKFDSPATVVRRLEEAGAVLVAKLSVGALAWGDDWFRGITRNPWHPKEGSSGSSAGSCSATSAGLVGFAIGSETLGSIVSPCTRCGVTGLRPTFGRVSRHGCMSLAWSMDKLGPIARTVEDCALIFAAIHGADGQDVSAVDRPFEWPARGELKQLRVGYFASAKADDERDELRVLRELGVQLKKIELPSNLPVGALSMILEVEAATLFDHHTRTGDTEGLNRWPAVFRKAEFVPAVEYLRANRVRSLLAREMEKVFEQVDCYIGGNDLVITNLTGHPTVVMPHGFDQRDGVDVPKAITFTGRLFGESSLLQLTHAYQTATGHHLKRPPHNV